MNGRASDVVVVGGGLAGAACALHLARRGVEVVVIDAAEFPRDKPCGEGLLPHGQRELAALGCADLLGACDAQPFVGILYRWHGLEARGDFDPGERGHGVRRLALDDGVRRRAAAAGARFLHDRVVGLALEAEGGAVALQNGASLRGRVVVGADGPRSAVRRALGLDGPPAARPRYALRRHFTLAAGAPPPERVEVNVVDGYELYVTPVGARIIGIAALCEKHVLAGRGGHADARLAALIDGCPAVRARLEGAVPASDTLSCGPLRVRVRGVHRGRAVLVGDAAGYVDAITGEGMSLGLKTARLAADAVAAVLGGEDAARAFARYAAERMRQFRVHAMVTHAVVALARRPALARRGIARLAREPALFNRLLHASDGTRMISPLDLLRLAVGASAP